MQILAATDPANPYGATLPWPKLEGSRRPARTANAYLALRDGVPLLYVERGGKGILRLAPLEGEELGAALEELSAAARDGVIEKLAIERLDGEPVIGTADGAGIGGRRLPPPAAAAGRLGGRGPAVEDRQEGVDHLRVELAS